MTASDLEVGDGITRRRIKKRIKLDMSDPRDAAKIATAFEQMALTAAQEWGPQQPIIAAIRQEAAQLRAELARCIGSNPAYLGSDEYAARYRERSTIAWYVLEMDANATMTELAMTGGRPWEAVSWAMKLAEALAEARLRSDWNRPAEVGRKQLDHSADGRAALRLQPASYRFACVQKLVCTGVTVRSAMRQVAAELEIGFSTVSRDYYAEKRSKPVD